jgi:hypothetical protein
LEVTVLRGLRIDQHPADGVTRALRNLAIVLSRMIVIRMPVIMMALYGRRSGMRNVPSCATARLS